jgi:hypothetical protein
MTLRFPLVVNTLPLVNPHYCELITFARFFVLRKIQVVFFERVLLFTTVLVIKPHNTAESVFFIAEAFVKLT